MKLARVLENRAESLAIVSPDGTMAITRDEIQKQMGLNIHSSVEEFIFHDDTRKLQDHLDKLSFKHHIRDLRILSPITKTFKIICLAFNYTDQTSWVRFGRSPQRILYFT